MEQVIKKPNFFIVGAAKAGTTSLAKYLSEHPDIFIPPEKEPRYFVREILLAVSDEDPMKQGILNSSILDQETYLKTYAVKEPLAGDASVHYLYHYKHVIPKIKSTVGDVPIIIMIRNPVDRLISHYSYLPNHKKSLEEEVNGEQEKIYKGFNSFWLIKSLGFYSEAIAAYKKNFSKVKVITFELFSKNPEKYYLECQDFLGVRQHRLESYEIHNKTVKPTRILKILSKLKITAFAKFLFPEVFYRRLKKYSFYKLHKSHREEVDGKVRARIYKFYVDDIEGLKNIEGVDLSAWQEIQNTKD